MAKSPTTGKTTPRQFRLRSETLADLDAIAAWLGQRDGYPRTRSDALRFAAREAVKKISKKSAE